MLLEKQHQITVSKLQPRISQAIYHNQIETFTVNNIGSTGGI